MDDNYRYIYIFEDINQETAKRIVSKINEINLFDDKEDTDKQNYIRNPINLIINSYGGKVESMFAIISAMLRSKTVIYTHIEGFAMSCAVTIALCGRYGHRTATKYSNLCLHGISCNVDGTLPAMENRINYFNALQKNYKSLFQNFTSIPMEIVDDFIKNSKDLYLTPEEALEYGIIDEII